MITISFLITVKSLIMISCPSTGLFLLPGPMATQVTTGEKVVTELSQQGALCSHNQHEEEENSAWHFIYPHNLSHKETRPTQSQTNSSCKGEDRVCHGSPLWGLDLGWGWGQTCSVENAKEPCRGHVSTCVQPRPVLSSWLF